MRDVGQTAEGRSGRTVEVGCPSISHSDGRDSRQALLTHSGLLSKTLSDALDTINPITGGGFKGTQHPLLHSGCVPMWKLYPWSIHWTPSTTASASSMSYIFSVRGFML